MAEELSYSKKDSVEYKGKVTVEFIKDGRVYSKSTSNAGTNYLFAYICKCLAGKINPSIAPVVDDRPGGLLMYTNGSTTPILSYPIIASGVTITNDDGASNFASIILDFLVPSVAVIGRRIASCSLTSLVPVTTGGRDYAVFAEASFPEELYVDDVNTSMYVHWQLFIRNGD